MISPISGQTFQPLYQLDQPILQKKEQLILKSIYCFSYILLLYLLIYNNLHLFGNEEGNAPYYWTITLVIAIARFGMWLTKKKQNKELKYFFYIIIY
jgi:hypothetical protein